MTQEQGKVLGESAIEIATTADIIDWYAEEGRRSYGRVIPARAKELAQPNRRALLIAAGRFGVRLRRHGTIAARELEELAQQARRHRGNRIDAQHRRARRADHLIGDTEQALVAAAEEGPDDRKLAEHVVEAVERNEGAAHADLVAMVIDVAIDGAADRGALEQPIADGEAAKRTGEIDAQVRELDTGRRAAGLLRPGSNALERRFSADDEPANVRLLSHTREYPPLRRRRATPEAA